MAREITKAQFDSLTAPRTRPIYIAQIQHDGVTVEALSSSGGINYDGQWYTAGGVNIHSVENGQTAAMSLYATPERIRQCIDGTWRGSKICRVYAIPATPDEDKPGTSTFEAADGWLLVDGYIDSSSVKGNWIEVKAANRHVLASYSPRLNCSELSQFTPAAGTLFQWESGAYILVKKSAR